LLFRLLLGRKFSDPELQDVVRALPYDVVEKDGRPSIKVRTKGTDKYFSPEEISAKVLEKLKDMAEEHLNRTVNYTIITVPAYFNDAQRQATKDAALIAGLNVLRIVNEPTAAAIAYGVDTKYHEEVNFLVYNLGAKESHLTLESVDKGVYEILAQVVDINLGGENFENAQTHTQQLNTQLSDRVVDLIKQLLKDARIEAKDVSGIIFTGNTSHIAKVQPLVEAYLDGKTSLSREDVSPDQAVVRGAAIQGHVLSSYDEGCTLIAEVSPLSLGIETNGGVFAKLIPRNTLIPTRKARSFLTATDNQETVMIKVLEGERAIANKNRLLGTLELTELPIKHKGGVEIEVTFEINADQILTVSAMEKETGNKAELVTSNNWYRYTMEELDGIIMNAQSGYEEDESFLKEYSILVQEGQGEDIFGVIAK
jgi:heat shock protein 5